MASSRRAFQFHPGSIKSRRHLHPVQGGDRGMFQFHPGSIKRLGSDTHFVTKELRFNSTLVLLKGC